MLNFQKALSVSRSYSDCPILHSKVITWFLFSVTQKVEFVSFMPLESYILYKEEVVIMMKNTTERRCKSIETVQLLW